MFESYKTLQSIYYRKSIKVAFCYINNKQK